MFLFDPGPCSQTRWRRYKPPLWLRWGLSGLNFFLVTGNFHALMLFKTDQERQIVADAVQWVTNFFLSRPLHKVN